MSDIVEKIGPIDRRYARNLADKYGLSRFAVFGSFARGEETAASDIDILVSWKDPPGLRRFMGLIDEIERDTGRKVDLAGEKGLHDHIKNQVLADAKDLL